MRYSDILGPVYHHIKFSSTIAYWIDISFTGAAHHLLRYRESKPNSEEEAFHSTMFERHLNRLKEIVFVSGDFRCAIDPTGCGLDKRASWNPEYKGIIDPTMFNKMKADERFGVGDSHINDKYLELNTMLSLTEVS